MLIARENELTEIKALCNSKKFEFLVMYGRRRVGKTEILKEISKTYNAIFFSAQEKNDLLNLTDFSKVLQNHFNDNYLSSFDNWENAFKYFADKSKKNSREILIIDEFPYIANENESIKSILQHIIDHDLKNRNVKLILCGSSVSSMEEGVLGSKSPLYGRATSKMEIKPLDYLDSFKFMGQYSIIDKFLTYGILGGIPHYLLQFDYKKDIKMNIANCIIKNNSILRDEPQTLLRMELREPAIYNSILEAISTSRNRLNEISNSIHEDSTKCLKYINVLKNIRIVEKLSPATEKADGKKSLYEIADNFIYFWYKFIFKNKSYYELLSEEKASSEIYEELSNYMGRIFEKISLQYMLRLAKNNKLPFVPYSYGKWWGNNKKLKKQDDIDILMVSKDKKQGIFCECKFKNEKVDINDYNDLVISSENFTNINDKHYYIISKSGFTKEFEKIKNKNLHLIKLDDMI